MCCLAGERCVATDCSSLASSLRPLNVPAGRKKQRADCLPAQPSSAVPPDLSRAPEEPDSVDVLPYLLCARSLHPVPGTAAPNRGDSVRSSYLLTEEAHKLSKKNDYSAVTVKFCGPQVVCTHDP
ncbi:uncharacterized protein LOC144329917 isoform X1 [Macaca mulatta]